MGRTTTLPESYGIRVARGVFVPARVLARWPSGLRSALRRKSATYTSSSLSAAGGAPATVAAAAIRLRGDAMKAFVVACLGLLMVTALAADQEKRASKQGYRSPY